MLPLALFDCLALYLLNFLEWEVHVYLSPLSQYTSCIAVVNFCASLVSTSLWKEYSRPTTVTHGSKSHTGTSVSRIFCSIGMDHLLLLIWSAQRCYWVTVFGDESINEVVSYPSKILFATWKDSQCNKCSIATICNVFDCNKKKYPGRMK